MKHTHFLPLALTLILTITSLTACDKTQNDTNEQTTEIDNTTNYTKSDTIEAEQEKQTISDNAFSWDLIPENPATDFEYKSDNEDGIIITAYIGTATVVKVPEEIDGLKVITIDEQVFDDRAELTNILLPESVTRIDDWAFSGCTGLTEFTIPSKVTTIGRNAFSGCTGLKNITVPESVTYLGNNCFYWCDNIQINFKDMVFNEDTEYKLQSYINCPDGFIIEDGDFKKCATYLEGEFIIPDNVTAIEPYAFSGCRHLTSVVIPDSVTFIGNGAFHYCLELTHVSIPDDVTYIGTETFKDCQNVQITYKGNTYTLDKAHILYQEINGE